MRKFIQFGFAVLLVSSVYCGGGADLCSTFTNQTDCTNNTCEWNKTPEFTCQSQNCSAFTKQQDCFAQKSSCQWTNGQSAACGANKTYCQVSTTDANTCNDANNCTFVGKQDATCTVKGSGFGCSKIADATECGKSNQCSWNAAFCKNGDYCRTQSADAKVCLAADGCQVVVNSCKTTTNSCALKENSDDCTKEGCVFDAAKNTCNPPTCTISNNCSDKFCAVSLSECSAIPNKCSGQENQDNCSGIKNCVWNDKGSCFDKAGYCNTEKCDTTFCVSTPATNPTCSPNNTLTQNCKNLQQNDCISDQYKAQCSFSQATPDTCTNLNQCGTFKEQNQCTLQQSCNWSNVYTCNASGTSSTTGLKIGVSVALMVVALLI